MSTMEMKKLKFDRHFTKGMAPGESVYERFPWRKLDVTVHVGDGSTLELKGVEVPQAWSDRAARIVADKYFRVADGQREMSVRQVTFRVVERIGEEGWQQGIFATREDLQVFKDELAFMLLSQRFAFNSPVWFNVGVPNVRQQASACFIQKATDDMEALGELQKNESRLFKFGSGTGSNLSPLRSSYENLSNGGIASGPVSFMEGFDAWAGVVKSGGGTRRAAKMVMLDVSHPDILQQKDGRPGFITCKAAAEKMAHDLIDIGYPGEFHIRGNAYEKVGFQNANNSVRVTDDFMKAVLEDLEWQTEKVTTGEVVHTYRAKQLFREMAYAAWFCGDPGVQYDTTINDWHTCPVSGRINGSNPCSEYMFLDDTACNLASHNLLLYFANRTFLVRDFLHANEVGITAMEILCGFADYPSEKIAENSRLFRPLGIGYANLGALLMAMGYAYDSDEGRGVAAAITALMSGASYAQSARMAQAVGPFEKYAENQDAFIRVLRKHRRAIDDVRLPEEHSFVLDAALTAWTNAVALAQANGVRNSQISVLAPTGTIGFMMDCDTTGVEPMTFLVANKKMVGGSTMRIATKIVEQALKNLGYDTEVRAIINQKIDETGDFPFDLVKPEHRTIFQTATGVGEAGISVMGHLKMMSAVQPFLSGAISKTVNMPESSTVEDVEHAYKMGWHLGLKAVAIYRDGCKRSQPLSKEKKKEEEVKPVSTELEQVKQGQPLLWGGRRRLPETRQSLTHKFSVGGQEGYLIVGMYADGTPGEVFINVSKVGNMPHGLADMWATSMSIGLQHGVPLSTFVEKFRGMKFEPAGFTPNPDIRIAQSIGDYIARFLDQTFLQKDMPVEKLQHVAEPQIAKKGVSYDGPPCSSCGSMTTRAGSCYVCSSCGTTTGCG